MKGSVFESIKYLKGGKNYGEVLCTGPEGICWLGFSQEEVVRCSDEGEWRGYRGEEDREQGYFEFNGLPLRFGGRDSCRDRGYWKLVLANRFAGGVWVKALYGASQEYEGNSCFKV